MEYDISIIGAGVAGALIARELSRYDLKVCIVDKDADVAMGTSKANSAIVHAGYDAKPGSLKAKLNVEGNALMSQVTKELDVPFKPIGSFVLAFNKEDMHEIEKLYDNGIENGVPHIKIITGDEARKMEPHISQEVIGALYAPTAGIVCPYELTLAATENAVANGVQLILECFVKDIVREADTYILKTTKGDIRSTYVINAAGVYSDDLARMIEDDTVSIMPRRGEYLLLDKRQGNVVNTVIFQPPSNMGKGVLVTPTVDGNLLIGPTAENIEDKEDISTTKMGLSKVIEGARKSVPACQARDVITSFAGLRATSSRGDFIIDESKVARGFVHVAGIESPGLSAAPAIATYVVKLLEKMGVPMIQKVVHDAIRQPVIRFRELSREEQGKVIRENPLYGNIICRCETVTEGEIVDAISRPAGATNVDGVKRRTRAGMGRCQGGFCAPRVVDILARELHIEKDEVTKMGGHSQILVGKTK